MQTRRPPSTPRIEPLELRIAPAALLHTVSAIAKLPDIAVPGDSGTVTFVVTNGGDAPYRGTSGIHIDLSSDASPKGNPTLAEYPDVPFSLDPGQTKTITESFKLPALQINSPQFPAGNIQVFVDVRQADNYGISAPHNYQFQFGDVGLRKNVKLPVIDSDGTFLSFTLSGGGTGTIAANGSTANLSFAGTTKTSSAGMSGPGGGDNAILLDDLSATAPLGKVALLRADVRGNVSFSQGLANGLQLNNLGGLGADHTLNIGSLAGVTDQPIKLIFRRVENVDFNVAAGIDGLQTGEWIDLNGDVDVITAPLIEKIVTKTKGGLSGDFGAALTVAKGNAKGMGLEKANIAGKLSEAVWTFGSNAPVGVGSIQAGDAVNWRLAATGAVKSVVLDSLDDSALTDSALEALSFGSILIGGTLKGQDITAVGADAKGVAIKNFEAGFVTLSLLDASAGSIGKISVDAWEAGSGAIEAKSLEVLTVRGPFGEDTSRFIPNLTLTAPAKDAKFSLGKALINATVTGQWTIAGSIGSLSVQATDATWKLTGDAIASDLDKLVVNASLLGTLDLASYGTISVQGVLGANVTARLTGAAFGKIKAFRITNATLTATDGSIQSVTVDADWQGGSAAADSIERIAVGAGLTNVGLTYRSDLARDDIAVKGNISNVSIIADDGHSFSNLTAAAWSGGGINGGSIERLSLAGNLSNATFKLRPSVPGGPALKGLQVGGQMVNTNFELTAGADRVSVGAMNNSNFTVTGADIAAFEIAGVREGTTTFFDQSTISADVIGSMIVRNVSQTAASKISAAALGNYKRYQGKDLVKTLHDLDMPDPAADVAGTYALEIR